MRTVLSLEGRPVDMIDRWTHLERTISGETERHLVRIVRHLALGCSVCRQEEVMEYLTCWPRRICTGMEALFVLDNLMAWYVASEQGRKDRAALDSGFVFCFNHDRPGPPFDEDGVLGPEIQQPFPGSEPCQPPPSSPPAAT